MIDSGAALPFRHQAGGGAFVPADRGGALNTRELLISLGCRSAAPGGSRTTGGRRRKKDRRGPPVQLVKGNRFRGKITTAILEEDVIADNASPELADIRRHSTPLPRAGRSFRRLSPPATARCSRRPSSSPSGRLVRGAGEGGVPGCSMPGLVHDVSSAAAPPSSWSPWGWSRLTTSSRSWRPRRKKEIDRILRPLR